MLCLKTKTETEEQKKWYMDGCYGSELMNIQLDYTSITFLNMIIMSHDMSVRVRVHQYNIYSVLLPFEMNMHTADTIQSNLEREIYNG